MYQRRRVVNPALMRRMHELIDRCEWPGCPRRAEHCHHIKPRGMGGGSRRDTPENLAMLCRICHDKAHGAPKLSREVLAGTHERRPEWLRAELEKGNVNG